MFVNLGRFCVCLFACADMCCVADAGDDDDEDGGDDDEEGSDNNDEDGSGGADAEAEAVIAQPDEVQQAVVTPFCL